MNNKSDTYPINEICVACSTSDKCPAEFSDCGVVDVYCLFYITKGQGYFTIDGKSFSAGAGQSVLIFPFSKLELRSDEENPWRLKWIKFKGFDAARLISKTSFSRDNPIVGSIPVDNFEKMFNLAPLRGVPYAVCRSNSKFLMLISYYLEYYPPETYRIKNYATMAREYIEKHYSNPECNVQKVSEYINLDRTYLYRLFKDETGTSIIDYINRCRIANASVLLKENILSIKDIAYSVGYTDQMYFSRVFKRFKGISPTKYRAISQNSE